MACRDPRVSVGRIYKEDHYTLLQTKYENSGPCGFGEEDFLPFSHCKSVGANDPRGGAILTPGAWLAGFIQRSTIHCYIQNMKALGLVVSEKKIFFIFFPCAPQGGARMDPRGMVDRIYKEDHYPMLHTKYESSGSCGYGEEYFLCFFPL